MILREVLIGDPDQHGAVEAGGIFFTTVQKFGLLEGESEHPVLCGRSNVVVISDEAHATELLGQLRQLGVR